jgi:hypothetical protein
MIWTRNSKDPLVRLLADRYCLHLLRLPREGVAVGDVYPHENGQVQMPGRLEQLLDPAPELPPLKTGERLADVSGTTSDAVSLDLGLDLLEQLLASLHAVGVAASLRAHMAAKRAAGIRFRFTNATRDSVDPFALERRVRQVRFDPEQSLLRESCRYYLVLGVVRSNAVGFTVTDGRSTGIDLSAEAASLAKGSAGVSVESSGKEEIVVTGSTPMAIGVELTELLLNKKRGRLEFAGTKDMFQVRADETGPAFRHSIIGEPDGDIFLDVPYGESHADQPRGGTRRSARRSGG